MIRAMDLVSPFLAEAVSEDGDDTARLRASVARLQGEVTRLREERDLLAWAVGHDELTGLANRRLFATLVPRLLLERKAVALVAVDLNGFKPINDRYGHETGDYVLRVVAGRLASWGGGDLVARLGGDEFACVLTRREWRLEIGLLSAAIARPIMTCDGSVQVTASIGVALARSKDSWMELLRRADLAMYQAKASRSCYAVWGSEPESAGVHRVRRTLEFTLYGSPWADQSRLAGP
jgi:diguanylate cyclase (GGDEF)-like protein